MGWSCGFDLKWDRDIGYGVPATCDHPGCGKEIDRGLSYVCGSEPYGGEHGCGLYFCGDHKNYREEDIDERPIPALCERCINRLPPFEPTPDVQEWKDWKRTDESWAQWRAENPEKAAEL